MALAQILKDSFSMKDAEYQDSQVLMDLADWDSMSHMIFITQLEEVFEVELNGNEILALQTIGDVKKLLESKGKKELI